MNMGLVSNFTLKTQIKITEQRLYCFSSFHSHACMVMAIQRITHKLDCVCIYY